ncbi:hypothetical protein [Bacillus mycoides]|nr:hypothetical protein [Bacillus mycoides]
MKKIILLLAGISTVFVLTLANANIQKETQLSTEEVVQYSHGNTGG